MQTILITGANGFVGKTLVRQLSGSANLVATGLGPCRISLNAPGSVYETLDITDSKAVDKLFERLRPDVVVHSAAISKPDVCEQDRAFADCINVSATAALLAAAERTKAHFVFLSTDFIFDGKTGMYREDDPAGPVNYYGQTKVMAEALVRAYPHLWTIARTVLVYGDPDGGRGNLLTMVAGALREGRPLKIFNDQSRTPTFVEDLAAGLVQIIRRGARGIYHLAGPDQRTPYQMAVETAELLGLDTSLITPVTEHEFSEPAKRPQKTGMDISKARKELGYSPVSFEVGLRRSFKKEHGLHG